MVELLLSTQCSNASIQSYYTKCSVSQCIASVSLSSTVSLSATLLSKLLPSAVSLSAVQIITVSLSALWIITVSLSAQCLSVSFSVFQCCTAFEAAAKCIPIEAEPYIVACADGVVSSLCALKPAEAETKFEAN